MPCGDGFKKSAEIGIFKHKNTSISSDFLKPCALSKRKQLSHPITTVSAKGIRERVGQFLYENTLYKKRSNVIFVCGGNEKDSMRQQFMRAANTLLPEYRFYMPEFSFNTGLEDGGIGDVDLDTFEKLIAGFSGCVVLFPESPGSYVELGVFSQNKEIVEKLLCVLDANLQGTDSFISQGPVKKIHSARRGFGQPLHVSYINPDDGFSLIRQRIGSKVQLNARNAKLAVNRGEWAKLDIYVRFAILHWLVDICRFINVETLIFLIRSFIGHPVKDDIVDICKVLIGCKELEVDLDTQMLFPSKGATNYVSSNVIAEEMLVSLRLDILSLYMRDDKFYGDYQGVLN